VGSFLTCMNGNYMDKVVVTLDGSVTSWLAWLVRSISRAKGPYMYNLPYAYAYALRRITLVLMHILIQPPSSYKSSFSYKTSDSAETHDPSTHATVVAYPGDEWRVASSEWQRAAEAYPKFFSSMVYIYLEPFSFTFLPVPWCMHTVLSFIW
jgi:hypothetical protein